MPRPLCFGILQASTRYAQCLIAQTLVPQNTFKSKLNSCETKTNIAVTVTFPNHLVNHDRDCITVHSMTEPTFTFVTIWPPFVYGPWLGGRWTAAILALPKYVFYAHFPIWWKRKGTECHCFLSKHCSGRMNNRCQLTGRKHLVQLLHISFLFNI